MDETGIIAWAHGYVLHTDGDDVAVYDEQDELVARQRVAGLHEFLLRARWLRFGWGQFPDGGDEVIYLFDAGDDNFGYALNLSDPHGSEWGYAPVEVQVEAVV